MELKPLLSFISSSLIFFSISHFPKIKWHYISFYHFLFDKVIISYRSKFLFYFFNYFIIDLLRRMVK